MRNQFKLTLSFLEGQLYLGPLGNCNIAMGSHCRKPKSLEDLYNTDQVHGNHVCFEA